MSLSLVFYAFLVRTAVGMLIALLPLCAMRPAERHVRFQLLVALVMLCLGGAVYVYMFAATAAGGPVVETGGGAGDEETFIVRVPWLVGLLALDCLIANFLFGTFRRLAGRVALATAALVGVLVVAESATFGPLGESGAGALATLTLNGLLGGAVMGGIVNAMILGHFYLVIRGLPLQALRRAGWFVAWALLAHVALLGLVLWLWGGAADVLLWSPAVIWTLWRIGFGFVGPLALLVMVKDTVRLQHTQAATGLLYVAVGFGILGELAAVYLEMTTGLPV